MPDRTGIALDALQALRSKLRSARTYRDLDPTTRRMLDGDLERITARLSPRLGGVLAADPYAQVMEGSPSGLLDRLQASAGRPGQQSGGQGAAAPATPAPAPQQQTATIGQRAAEALEAVNFPAFVASLLTGTFQAIVDASVQQLQEYARLVASLSQSVESFAAENVTVNQARDHLAQAHPQDLMVVLPEPGRPGMPRLLPRPDREETSPEWLSRYALEGESLTEELTEGPLLEAGRTRAGEERLQMLATMVLMGINRVVVNEGDVRAKLQFHAAARDSLSAEMQMQGMSIAARGAGGGNVTQMMVSTVKANAQADAAIKADLMGEVRISFRSETFPLERFADSAALQLINRHARWRNEPEPAAPGAPAPAPPAPAPATPPASATAPAPAAGTTP
jgi:hypothetical protein